MARASITVRSQHEADAVKLSLSHPAIQATQVITGLLLQLPVNVRPQVMQIVESQLVLALPLFDEPAIVDERVLDARAAANGDGEQQLRLHDGE